MSLLSSFETGVSGLTATSTALSTISNNITNANTTAYKASGTDFAALINTSDTASGATTTTGSGVSTTTTQNVTTQGTLASSDLTYSMAIDGQGFFVTSDTATTDASSTYLYTRDGSFSTDSSGNLVNSSGDYLMGWTADSSGTVDTSNSLSSLSTINLTDLSSAISATQNVSVDANLSSSTTVSDAASTYSVLASPMYTYDSTSTDNSTSTEPDKTITATVSDSDGNMHQVEISLLKTDSTSDQWNYEIYSDDAQGTLIDSGNLTFDSSGNIASISSDSGSVSSDKLTTSAVNWVDSSGDSTGVDSQSLTFDLSSLTQTASDTSVTSVTADGTPSSSLSSVDISSSGLVTANYADGSTRTLAQIATATFINADGLTAASGNSYTASTSSGTATLKVPGQGGSGTLDVGYLEESNVDLSTQLTSLITIQRSYSAASKVITTADQMMQELLSVKT